MTIYNLKNRPNNLTVMRKTSTIAAVFVIEPFVVETQEGVAVISPETVEDWNGGYWLAYPDDGSNPYAISPSFMTENYEVAQ